MQAYCLTIHAGYRCHHSGACCTAGWTIPIEPERVVALRALRMTAVDGARQAILQDPTDATAFTAAKTPDGACVFFDAAHGRLCAIHRDAGEALLPTACRHFPRIALRDGRGVSVTLSHYCPSAARLLLDADDIAVVEAPPSLSLQGEVEGLDASGVLPPLLRPGMLTDLPGYAAWEQAAVAVLNRREWNAAGALDIIRSATLAITRWQPGGEPLADRVLWEFAQATPRRMRDGDAGFDRPTKAFLAGHLFANWAAYQRGGLLAVVDYLNEVLARLRAALQMERANPIGSPRDEAERDRFISAVRMVDLRLRHTGDHRMHHACAG
jgi:Fe-S-cluster containining protein